MTTDDKAPQQRVLTVGLPDHNQCDNAVTTSKYTWYSFFPVAVGEQFRRKGNVYFLVMGCLMALGWYTRYFDSAISPWTTLGPLAVVIGVSITQEGFADLSRHRSDAQTNKHACTVLTAEAQGEESSQPSGDASSKDLQKDSSRTKEKSKRSKRKKSQATQEFVKNVNVTNRNIDGTVTERHVNIEFQSVQRRDIRAGHLVFIKNREMIPCDVVLLASSNENGGAYIETSGIDGETNLKLRNSAKPSPSVAASGKRKYMRDVTPSKVKTTGEPKAEERVPFEGKTPVSEGNDEAPPKLSVVASSTPLEDNIASETRAEEHVTFEGKILIAEGNAVALHEPPKFSDVASSPKSSALKADRKFAALTPSKQLPAAASNGSASATKSQTETLEEATARLANCTVLGCPSGKQASSLLEIVQVETAKEATSAVTGVSPTVRERFQHIRKGSLDQIEHLKHQLTSHLPISTHNNTPRDGKGGSEGSYVAVITYEPPNASVHTFNGKLTLPPPVHGGQASEVPLSADNFLLRGAFLRNTEWAIGVACYSGKDTKLVKNLSAAPSRLSQLDKLVNRTIMIIIAMMMLFVLALSIGSLIVNKEYFDTYWYLGYSKNANEPWPYLPNLEPPQWEANTSNLLQNMFLFTTLLNNFVPLSLYVTMEVVTRVLMMYINTDVNMYHEETDTPASARSTTVTDLGQIKYIFSDKTGTLTQNVMRFKRCSVDGILFGAPVVKSSPPPIHSKSAQGMGGIDEVVPVKSFHPLRKLLVGAGIPKPTNPYDARSSSTSASRKFLTFNTEMFLRVMSICHTVVVENDHHGAEAEVSADPKQLGSWLSGSFSASKPKNKSNASKSKDGNKAHLSEISVCLSGDMTVEGKSVDGAPLGQSYQAESPDEGALVSAASIFYGFQLLGRSSSGISIACSSSSLLQSTSISEGLKSGSLTTKQLAALSASAQWDDYVSRTLSEDSGYSEIPDADTLVVAPRKETWQVLAVNKFDSTRKRMSVLVRSPEELGGVLMLLCKGADSAMLDPSVCELSTLAEANATDDEDFVVSMLSVEAHLGEFASEGLRTLVLGVRILSEDDGSEWLSRHAAAASSISNREKKLREVAIEIERELHIVGVTAIEDKLQKGVPETISKLAKAGIKLFVLTGDKRETAIEIGYSTKVLTPEMSLFQVAADGGQGSGAGSTLAVAERVRAMVANEFLRLVKIGDLPQYQKKALDAKSKRIWKYAKRIKDTVCTTWNLFSGTFSFILCLPCRLCSSGVSIFEQQDKDVEAEEKPDNKQEVIADVTERRKAVRQYAEVIISEYLEKQNGGKTETVPPKYPSGQESVRSHDSDGVVDMENKSPTVFDRATLAEDMLREKISKGPTSVSLRSLSIASVGSKGSRVLDEDARSLQSFFPRDSDNNDFDGQKRTILERLFAVDSDVRHGRLRKHAKSLIGKGSTGKTVKTPEDPSRQHTETMEILAGVEDSYVARHVPIDIEPKQVRVPRALIIEGAALTHLMGDPRLDEMIFSVASSFDAVIACRVSPKQKALLVRTVRTFVEPEPITLAIGDGANDVGMIQEAHVGVGISGMEGQQAVNASDFAIAQFRFLEELLLIHGRYNFNRMARVVLFSFYKNAVLAGLLVVYAGQNLFSGTTLFDDWLISLFNFVCTFPIFFVGLFDRDVDKDYVRRNPQLYGAGPHTEELSLRKVFRWVTTTLIHLFTIYYLSIPVLDGGGAVSSAFQGLMHFGSGNKWPGDGEGDYLTNGTAVYTVLVFTLAYKALFETRSILNGECPTCFCKEPFWSRLPWTWLGATVGSIIFFIWGTYMYQIVALQSSTFFGFIGVATHTYQMRRQCGW